MNELREALEQSHKLDQQFRWRVTLDEVPLRRNEPVLCAWKRDNEWHYAVAKWTGKRWLEVEPEADNEEFRRPVYWRYINPPEPEQR